MQDRTVEAFCILWNSIPEPTTTQANMAQALINDGVVFILGDQLIPVTQR